ncbi:unnamed protein product [Paramecium sonneborni]|uniref:CHHC U11-48K-type domain-containing protein n=1 Tax=Paramecium sonneborni TaxID=65129 RepID=A0A8S1LAR4_9CILI|nr:unnamed protein product [Paramecium sonneborni]
MQQQQQVCCPFNNLHKMAPNRLIFHISRECQERKMNKHMYRHCPFNFLHIFRGEDMEQHLISCPDKKEPDKQIQIEQNNIENQFLQGDPNWGQKNPNDMMIEMPINQNEVQQDNTLIDQFNNLKLQRQDDIWDQIWKQHNINEDDFDMLQ